MTNTIKAIKVTADSIEVVEIENTLEALQNVVKGWIEVVPLMESNWYDVSFKDDPQCALTIVCNEEGKFQRLNPTIALGTYGTHGQPIPYDVVMGDALIMATSGEDFASLTDEQIEAGMEWIDYWHYSNGNWRNEV